MGIPKEIRAVLHQLNPSILLAQDCCISGVETKESHTNEYIIQIQIIQRCQSLHESGKEFAKKLLFLCIPVL